MTGNRDWKTSGLWLLSLAALAMAGCSGLETGVYRENAVTDSGEPAYVTIQHCLIGVVDGLPEKTTRTQAEAEVLANELYQSVLAGEDFDAIVRQNTDDSFPGRYQLANDGFPGDKSSRLPSRHITARGGMVAAFGDVGFSLEVGEVGLAPYDPDKSKFGWHIIKRLR